jgi:Ca2+-binding EF-hand superfamily protein
MQMASVVRDEVKEIFDRIDHDRDGRVSCDELRVWLAR